MIETETLPSHRMRNIAGSRSAAMHVGHLGGLAWERLRWDWAITVHRYWLTGRKLSSNVVQALQSAVVSYKSDHVYSHAGKHSSSTQATRSCRLH